MRKKKYGTSIIEVIMSMAILSILISVSTSLIIKSNKMIHTRKEVVDGERIIYAIMQEIKYNYTMDQLLVLFNNSSKSLSSEGFLEDIKTKELFDCDSGDNIRIILLEADNDEYLKFNVLLKNDNNEKISERDFYKYKWMDIGLWERGNQALH